MASWKCKIGLHDWKETYRYSRLWDDVGYACRRECGAVREYAEFPDRGQYSMDKEVAAKQKQDNIARVKRK